MPSGVRAFPGRRWFGSRTCEHRPPTLGTCERLKRMERAFYERDARSSLEWKGTMRRLPKTGINVED
jgi:hypothetical protein